MMLNFMFEEVKGKIDLGLVQVCEVDVMQALMAGFKRIQHGLFDARHSETAREALPAAHFDPCEVTFTRPDDAPELARYAIGG